MAIFWKLNFFTLVGVGLKISNIIPQDNMNRQIDCYSFVLACPNFSSNQGNKDKPVLWFQANWLNIINKLQGH